MKKKKQGVSLIPFENIKKEGVTINEIDYALKIVRDGKLNDFPDYLTKIVNESPTASACMKRVRDFVTGRGVHPDIEEIEVSPGKTFWEFHKEIAYDYSFYDRLSAKVSMNRGFKTEKIIHTPVEWVRYAANLNYNDPFYPFAQVNPYLNTTQQLWGSEQIKTYRLYESIDPKDLRGQRMEAGENYSGHLLFHNDTRPGARLYSRPEWFAAERAIVTDGRIWAFHDRNTANNFFIGGILSILADPDAGVGETDENGTYYQTFRDVFEQKLNDYFGGVENAGGMMVFYKDNEADPDPQLTPPPTQVFENLFTNLLKDTVNTICYSFGVPKILLPQEISGKLGASNEIRNAIQFMNETTKSKRETLEKIYKKLLDGMGVSYPEDEALIEPIQDFTDLPDAIFAALSSTQRETYLQESFGIEPDEENAEEMESEEETIEEIINQNGNHNPVNN